MTGLDEGLVLTPDETAHTRTDHPLIGRFGRHQADVLRKVTVHRTYSSAWRDSAVWATGLPIRTAGTRAQATPAAVAVRYGCRDRRRRDRQALPLSAACWWAMRRARKGAAFDLLRRG